MNHDWGAYVRRDIAAGPSGSGALDGLTFAVKDVFDIQGYTSSAGNPDWLQTHGPADRHAVSIQLLLSHGARLTGTTHTDELMYSLDGENEHYGTPVNPKAPERIPGGSSSGSAVAVSAGLVDFALGTDTGGSVRIPSSYCGIYGFRPTHGLVDMSGVIPLAPSFDTVGWMARDSKTLLDVGQVLLGGRPSVGAEFRHIYFAHDAWSIADAKCRDALTISIPFIHRVEECKWIHLSPSGLTDWMNAFRTLQGLEIWETHGAWVEQTKPRFGTSIGKRFSWASTLQKDASHDLVQLRKDIRHRMSELLGDDGLLVIPTAPGIAPLRGQSGEEVEIRRARTLQLCCIAGLAGLPQVTLPVAEINGSPIGLSVIAGLGQDVKLLEWIDKGEQR
ncbi:amidase [Cohnella sp. CFH 77786]|uniref:amidase n=1 Tax=Cohnella sp. CFH 77786 TaxID=2662265 RepID=UPI001C60BE59|nr:amidase [Cohnella sp. CFH 77786]MBW5448914.1 amidase [Cohnella sp. CFH 77786]